MPSQEHQQIIDLLRSSAADGPEAVDVAGARKRLDTLGTIFSVPDGVSVKAAEIAGISCERSVPSNISSPATVLYLHGGSYSAGSLVSHRALCARMAVAAGCEVIAVDYRLAPEHPFPAGLDDAAAVWRQLLDEGIRPEDMIVAGDSAGGGLTTALLLRLRDEGVAMPAGGVLLSPRLDLTLQGASMTQRAEDDPMLTEAALAEAAQAYADELAHPLASPLFADLAGLPPLLVLVGTAEVLLDDSTRFADRARAAGVEVDLDVEEGLIHVWPFLDGVPEAAAAMERIAGWIATHTG